MNSFPVLVFCSNDGGVLGQAALRLLARSGVSEPIRLVGVAASRIEAGEPEQLSLLPSPAEDPRRRRLNRVVDEIRERFGSGSLARAEDRPVERSGLTEQIKAGEDPS